MSANGDLHGAAAVLIRRFGPLRPTGWTWREPAYGRCVRCRWPAHTQAGGNPVHPFCYLNPDPASAYSDKLRRWDGDRCAGCEPGPPRPAFVPERHQDNGERQWCATGGRWFDPTPERLAVCANHAAEKVSRWQR